MGAASDRGGPRGRLGPAGNRAPAGRRAGFVLGLGSDSGSSSRGGARVREAGRRLGGDEEGGSGEDGKEEEREGRERGRSRAGERQERAALASSPGVQVPHLRPLAAGAGRIPPERLPRRAPADAPASHVFRASISGRTAELRGRRAGTAVVGARGQVEGDPAARLHLARLLGGRGPREDAVLCSPPRASEPRSLPPLCFHSRRPHFTGLLPLNELLPPPPP